MAKGANMKVNMTADNSDLLQKAKESKQALKDFEKVGDYALSRLGEAFGVNTGKIEQMASAIQGLGSKMEAAGGGGVKALGSLISGAGGVAGGIIGAAIAGFKLLGEEAENFRQTVAGANMELATEVYVDTYRQVIHDFNREIGQGTAEAQSSWKKFWGTIGARMKASFATGAFAAAATPGYFNNQALVTYNNLLTEAGQKARTAAEISDKMYEVTRQMSDKTVEWARMEREIAEYKRIAYDKTSSPAQQQEALNKAVDLTKKKFGEQADMQKKLADLQAEYNNLANSSLADIDKANQLRIQEENTIASMNNALRELNERQASISDSIKKSLQIGGKDAAQYLKEQRFKILKDITDDIKTFNVEAMQEISSMPLDDMADSLNISLAEIDADMNAFLSKWKQSVEKVAEYNKLLENSIINSFAGGIQALMDSIFQLENADWKSVLAAFIAPLGDTMKQIGALIMAEGVAMKAFKNSFTNPWAAIATGATLIAIGSVVSAGLSKLTAGGSYSSSASVATSGNYGSSPSVSTAFDTREMNIKVSGNLYASGNQLMAVIENENNRKNHTT